MDAALGFFFLVLSKLANKGKRSLPAASCPSVSRSVAEDWTGESGENLPGAELTAPVTVWPNQSTGGGAGSLRVISKC